MEKESNKQKYFFLLVNFNETRHTIGYINSDNGSLLFTCYFDSQNSVLVCGQRRLQRPPRIVRAI